MGVYTQFPFDGLHVSVVQALLSLQFLGVYLHPLAGSQVSVVQALLSLQFLAMPTHTPLEQASRMVQRLPSSQGSPTGPKSGTGVWTHFPVAGSQVSVVQMLLSSQLIGV